MGTYGITGGKGLSVLSQVFIAENDMDDST